MTEQRGPRISPRFVVGTLLVVLLVIFAFENRQQTKIRLILPQVTFPLWIALLGAAAIGAVAAALLTRQRRPKEQ